MSGEATAERLKLDFGASVAEVDEATRTLRRFLKAHAAGRDTLTLLLLFREAALNAARHGIKASGDDAQRAAAEIRLEAHGAFIIVQDPGLGFDWRNASFDAPPPDAESGRGLFVLASNADRIAYNDAGNTVELYKRFEGES